MPISSITKEEKLEVLTQDTRDFCNRNKERYGCTFAEGADDLQIHDVVRFFDSFSDMIPVDVVDRFLRDKDEAKINELHARAQAGMQALALKGRWYALYGEWEGPVTHSRRASDSLSSRHWER